MKNIILIGIAIIAIASCSKNKYRGVKSDNVYHKIDSIIEESKAGDYDYGVKKEGYDEFGTYVANFITAEYRTYYIDLIDYKRKIKIHYTETFNNEFSSMWQKLVNDNSLKKLSLSQINTLSYKQLKEFEDELRKHYTESKYIRQIYLIKQDRFNSYIIIELNNNSKK